MEYETSQKNLVSEYFKAHSDSTFSIEEIVASLPLVGKSTIYRQIAKLEKNGTIKKLDTVKGETPRYQYLECHCNLAHFHLVCVNCGAILHLSPKVSEKLVETIGHSEGFKLSVKDTTLYGLCKQCQEKA